MRKISYDTKKVVSGILQFLAESGQSDLLPQITANLDSLISDRQKAKEIVITSCVLLTISQTQQLSNILKKYLKADLPMVNRLDKNLLGGFTVRAGDWFLDASLSKQIQNISNNLAV